MKDRAKTVKANENAPNHHPPPRVPAMIDCNKTRFWLLSFKRRLTFELANTQIEALSLLLTTPYV